MTSRPIREGDEPGDRAGRPIRIRIMTVGLALVIPALVVGIGMFSQRPWNNGAAHASCEGLGGYVLGLSMSSPDRTVLSCTLDGMLTSWEPGSHPTQQSVFADRGPSFLAAFAPDHSTLAVAGRNGTVTLWDLNARKRGADIPPDHGFPTALAVGRGGLTLAVGDRAGVRVLDATTQEPVSQPRIVVPSVRSLALSPDGRVLAIGGGDGTICLWDLAERRERATFRAHQAAVHSLSFAENRDVLASASIHDRVTRLWESVEGRLLGELQGRTEIQTLVFAPGGRLLAAAELSGHVRHWDTVAMESREVYSTFEEPVMALAYSPDGRTLACGSFGTIRLYRVDENEASAVP